MKYKMSKRVKPFCLVKIKGNKVTMTTDLSKAHGQYLPASENIFLDLKDGTVKSIRYSDRIAFYGGN